MVIETKENTVSKAALPWGCAAVDIHRENRSRREEVVAGNRRFMTVIGRLLSWRGRQAV
jgi:hypothetical protein